MRPILVAPFYILIQSIAAIYGGMSNLIYNIYIYNVHELVKFIGAIEVFNITHIRTHYVNALREKLLSLSFAA